ncbi:MAG: MMPL family transporter [Streptosporangiaceae bacterium]
MVPPISASSWASPGAGCVASPSSGRWSWAKAVVFNLISLAAAYGVLTWVWQDGHGSNAVWGIPATGAITMWVPLMVFAFLFGLSMDYEVFILTRIREVYDETGDARRAVTAGLGRTGRLVTSAAAILMLSFLSMSTGPQTDLKILATGLGAGISSTPWSSAAVTGMVGSWISICASCGTSSSRCWYGQEAGSG